VFCAALQGFTLAPRPCHQPLLIIRTAQSTLRVTFTERAGTQFMTFRAIITGATGMVGEGVLLECLSHPAADPNDFANSPREHQHTSLRACPGMAIIAAILRWVGLFTFKSRTICVAQA
jgi:hypothetical protein